MISSEGEQSVEPRDLPHLDVGYIRVGSNIRRLQRYTTSGMRLIACGIPSTWVLGNRYGFLMAGQTVMPNRMLCKPNERGSTRC
jgi:hypothetical protein